MEKEEGLMVKGRAIIDTRPPFRSVKEAVALFGERVLVGEIYAKQLKEIQPQTSSDKKPAAVITPALETTVTVELEETRQNLKKAREEGNYMANCLKSLRDELEQTKKELRQLKAAKEVIIEHPKVILNPEIEELKFVEINNANFSSSSKNKDHIINDRDIDNLEKNEYQKKKLVSFASPPSLTRELKHNRSNNYKSDHDVGAARLGRTPSFRKEGKKKPPVPIMGWLFPKKKKNYEANDRSPFA